MSSVCQVFATLSALVVIAAPLSETLALTTNLVPVADTSLFEQNPNNNLGGMDVVIAGTIALGKHSRALLKFDIAAALPANAAVSSVILNLSVAVAHGANQDYRLHRVLRDWGEGDGSGGGGGSSVQGGPADANEATWSARFHPGVLWTVPGSQAGSDYVATSSANATMGLSALTFSSLGMASDIQMWLDSPSTNFGWMLMIANEGLTGTASRIPSREAAVGMPRLSIDYSVSSTPAPPTPPTLSAPVLEAGNLRFSFDAESNRTYTVQFRDSLTAGNWAMLTNIPAQPANATIHITNAVVGAGRFFRVQTP